MKFGTRTRISKNKHAVNRAIILVTPLPHCLFIFFSLICLFVCLFVCYRKKPKNQLNGAHGQLLKNLRPIGHLRHFNILTWIRGFQVKFLYLLLFSLYPSLENFAILTRKPRSQVTILIPKII